MKYNLDDLRAEKYENSPATEPVEDEKEGKTMLMKCVEMGLNENGKKYGTFQGKSPFGYGQALQHISIEGDFELGKEYHIEIVRAAETPY